MTCKDCIHFEVCDSGRHIGEHVDDDGVYSEGVENKCPAFKQTKMEWISVEERLPENDDELVLVTASGKVQENITLLGAYFLATYSKNDGWILEGFEHWNGFEVAYWCKLPSPPDGRRK